MILTGVIGACNMTPMVKTQVYLGPEELEALHRMAAQSHRSVADLIREAIRRVWLRPAREGPVGLWNGQPGRSSVDHDSIYDNP
jgi:ribbon-helix-helix CopG family protein